MKKKIIILLFIVIIFLIVIFAFWDSECKEISNGWLCEFKTGLSIPIYALKCGIQDGQWTYYGIYHTKGHDFYCNFILNDAGKECINSDQCIDKCIIREVDEIRKNCLLYPRCKGMDIKGNCSDYALRECDSFIELNDGLITEHWMFCD